MKIFLSLSSLFFMLSLSYIGMGFINSDNKLADLPPCFDTLESSYLTTSNSSNNNQHCFKMVFTINSGCCGTITHTETRCFQRQCDNAYTTSADFSFTKNYCSYTVFRTVTVGAKDCSPPADCVPPCRPGKYCDDGVCRHGMPQ